MIILRTGKPGHGKTLNAIREIDEKAFKAGRVVYYHNVTGLKPEKLQAAWFEFDDATKWYELPADAIIVVDEAQGSAAVPMFGVRDPRKPIPEHVSRLELIRKNGHELHLITQDPRFLDVHARRLADGHIHFVRVFKSAQLLRFESQFVIEEVEKKTAFKDADKQPVKIDRRFFDVYQSANAGHHFKVKLPKKFLLASLVIVVAAGLVFRAVERYKEGALQDQASPAAAEKSLVDKVSDKVDSVLAPEATAAPKTKAQYLASREPRIPDIPSSAPVYDELTKPVSHPRMYCLSTSDPFLVAKRPPDTVKDGVSCQCYSQQATRVATSFDFCFNAATYGFFDASLPDRQSLENARANPPPTTGPAQVPPFGPDAPPKQVRVTQVPYVKGEFLW
ncbi:zonular occludens toxin [Pseudomonas sp. DY-1]|uniref:zonular occludens toxin domain-containing protein n=1 Tax=Pseudomonas sp. DY-1 TaxID=1755504 RepID=UPI000EAA1548|nr:zonular occludens toxin domain-containing protein [Pseudomonas sp. DY-1]AYF85635.1 zonular occludens toxin [Pseudomonas sp. DY-1]AYF85652.1 zonular occludens toxin [Pseudomonas sp. DY-1]AYF85672.1 zonular occludens toxin [Pseudomonas sp. DY-1]AYF85689.1 zonular occludens toxin [Pseudomonas sp. DY-1]AYF85707.1 zonular occludens toxin [Pseudomonas sp. DY-1]